MQIVKNIKKQIEEKDLKQKEVVNALGVHTSNYSKIKKGEREFSIEVIDKIAKFLGLSIHERVHLNFKIPKLITVAYNTTNEKVYWISQSEEKKTHCIPYYRWNAC